MTNGKIDKLNQELAGIKESFDLWEKSGLNQEVLIIYLHHKTKLSKRGVKNLLYHQKDFFDKLIKDEVVGRMEE